MSRVPSTEPKTDTKEQILNAAERQFALFGFAGASLRAVTRDANVNLAAVHYHFGSKEELFKAVVQRVAEPIVREQMRHLDELENFDPNPSVVDIVQAFVARPLEMILKQRGESCYVHAQFVGRCRTEPRPIQELAEVEFNPSHQRFLELIHKALPHQSFTELEWKLDLIVAMIVRVLKQTEYSDPLSEKSDQEIDNLIQRLVRFILSGISA
ncbi:bacterial regulatory s, tetR family protein [Lyngbya aestuarii BL J]|uniref:Bacterial regulatory s, tetR family protein n=2 Tax=Lyngbya aestuarii BL J TaxID=1348334 RepID=U7QM31_9CYAN|nr:TetR/AcrR family transcriptional regulator [Lyngbya aestuarii]ERT08347.1 bacterial regulatory s, tetR family protein [Lyngbya aestuarii BL J]